MTLDVVLRQYLLGDTAIAALVVNVSETDAINRERIFPIRLPQKVKLPAITFQQVSDHREAHLRGPGGLARARYQIDAYALKPLDAKTLGGLIRQRMDACQGEWSDGASPATTVRVQAAFFESAMDLFDADINGGSSRHSADFFVIHNTNTGVI